MDISSTCIDRVKFHVTLMVMCLENEEAVERSGHVHKFLILEQKSNEKKGRFFHEPHYHSTQKSHNTQINILFREF